MEGLVDKLLSAIIGTLVIGGIIRFALIDVNVRVNLPGVSTHSDPPSIGTNPSPPSPLTQPSPLPQSQLRTIPSLRCVAIVMSNTGVWGVSQGARPCEERLEHARAACERASANCGNLAASTSWVAGVYCFKRWGNGWQRNQYPAAGSSEEEAFQKAYEVAGSKGWERGNCVRKVSAAANGNSPNRYN